MNEYRRHNASLINKLEYTICADFDCSDYKSASNRLAQLLQFRDTIFIRADLALTLCLSGKYRIAMTILEEIIYTLEHRKNPDKSEILTRSYCMYALCLQETGYIKESSFYYH